MALEGKVRKIVAEDINFGTGTVTIQKADGTTVIANQININTIPYGVKRPVLTLDQFKNALSELSTSGGVIEVCSPITLDADVTIPENIWLDIKKDCPITVPAGITLTVDGGIIAGLYKIFDGAGVVVGSPKIAAVYPEWFGAIGDGIADDSEAIQKAVDFYNFVFLSKRYLIHTPIKLKNNTTIVGYYSDFKNLYSSTAYDKYGVGIILGAADKAFYIDVGEGKSFRLANFSIFVDGYTASSGDITSINYAAGKIGIDISYSQDVVIEGIKFYNLEYGVYAQDANQTGAQWTARPVIKDIRAYECRYAIYTAPKTGTYVGLPYADFLVDKLIARNCEVAVELNNIDGVDILNSVIFQSQTSIKIANSTIVNLSDVKCFETVHTQCNLVSSSYISMNNVQLVRAGWLGETATALEINECSNVKLNGVTIREQTGIGINIINSSSNIVGCGLLYYALDSSTQPFLYTLDSSDINLKVNSYNVPVGFTLFNNAGSTNVSVETNIVRDYAGNILITTPEQQDVIVEAGDTVLVAASGGVYPLAKLVFSVPAGAKLKLIRYACYLPSGLIGRVNGQYPNTGASIVSPESKNITIYDNSAGTSTVAVTVSIEAENTSASDVTIYQYHNIYCRFAIEK